MILYTLLAFWLINSIAVYIFARKTFKKYKNYPRIQVQQRLKAAVRTDFGKWDEAAILWGAFFKFPFHFWTMLGFLIGYAFFAVMQSILRYPDWVVDFWRLNVGRLSFYVCFNLIEEFDYKEKIKTPIIIANHSAWVDFIYMGGCLEPVSFVSKKEVQKIPVLSSIAKYIRTLYIDRSSKQSRLKIREQIQKRVHAIQEKPAQNYPIIIYPEGTVSNGRSIISFKNGAFEPLCPITIFSLKYQCKQFHLGLDEVSSIANIIFCSCLTPTIRVRKTVVEPKPSQTVDQYRERCRKELSNLSGFPMYDCDFKDMLEYEKKILALVKQQKSKA